MVEKNPKIYLDHIYNMATYLETDLSYIILCISNKGILAEIFGL